MKNIQINKIVLLLLALVIISSSCKNNDEVNPDEKNNITLSFDNQVGSDEMTLGTSSYKNSSGEDFTITTFNYFISSVSFKKADGTVVKYPNDYFLIKQSDSESSEAILKDVPVGDYKEVTFTIGVDSARSVSELSQRTGVLDPASYGTDNMYWAWNSGYIFFKIEGTSSVVPSDAAGKRVFQYHVGGFGGMTTKTINNLRTVTLSLPTSATVRSNIAPEIHLFVDALKVFNGTSTLKLATTNMVHSIGAAVPIADNYKTMFSVNHVHNDVQ